MEVIMESKKPEYVRLSVRIESDTRERIYKRADVMGVRPSAYSQIAFTLGEQLLWNMFQGQQCDKQINTISQHDDIRELEK
jgi:hypothetical protein